MAFDVLSFVMGQQAGKASGGSSVGGQKKTQVVTLAGTHGERVSVDFGFQPDFIMVFPYDHNVLLTGARPFIYLGFSQRIIDACGGADQFCCWRYQNADSVVYDYFDLPIEYATDYKYTNMIYGADETGFNLGAKGNPVAAGKFYVWAYKFF